MTVHSVTLTDVAAGIYEERFEWKPSSERKLAGSDRWSLTKRRLKGGVSDGVDVVEIDNGALSVSVLPTRGMGLWRGRYDGIELGWQSPVTLPVHPSLVNATDRNGLGWLAGFNEWLCRCGLSSFGPPGLDRVTDESGRVVAEWPLTLHGKIANLPAHRVTAEVDTENDGCLRLTGVVDESSLFGPRFRLTSTMETVAGSNRLKITDTVANLSGQMGEMALLYHINIGRPLLEGGAKVSQPAREMCPRDAHAAADLDRWNEYLPPTAGYREQCYLFDPVADDEGRTVALLRNRAGDKGMTVRYSPQELPCFTLWKNTQAEGDGYVTGLEPGTGFPNLRSFERANGRVRQLPPGESFTMSLELAILSNGDAVRNVEAEIAELQRCCEPRVLREPHPHWAS